MLTSRPLLSFTRACSIQPPENRIQVPDIGLLNNIITLIVDAYDRGDEQQVRTIRLYLTCLRFPFHPLDNVDLAQLAVAYGVTDLSA